MQAKTADFEEVLIQPGLHPFRLVQIIDMGTQKSNFDPGGNSMLEFVFEFPTILHVFNQEKGPEPLVKSRSFGNSLGPKSKMKQCIEGLLGRSIEKTFPLDTLVPTLAQVLVGVKAKEDGSGWRNEFLSFMPATQEQLAAGYPEYADQFVFDLDNFNEEVFQAIPKFKQDRIVQTKEYAAAISTGRFPGAPQPGMPAGQPAQPHFAGQPPAAPAGYPQQPAAPQWPVQPQQPAQPAWTPPAAQPAPAPAWAPPAQPAAPAPQWAPPGQPAPAPYQAPQPGVALPWEQPTQHVPQTPPPTQWMSPPPAGQQVSLPLPGQAPGQPVATPPKRGRKIGGAK